MVAQTVRHPRTAVANFIVPHAIPMTVLLGVIVAEVVSQARMESEILSSLRSRTVARYSAESGILAATVRIEELLNSARSLPERITTFRDLTTRLAALNDVALGAGGSAWRWWI